MSKNEFLTNGIKNVCNSVCKVPSVYSTSIENIAQENSEKIKEKYSTL